MKEKKKKKKKVGEFQQLRRVPRTPDFGFSRAAARARSLNLIARYSVCSAVSVDGGTANTCGAGSAGRECCADDGGVRYRPNPNVGRAEERNRGRDVLRHMVTCAGQLNLGA
jgi:hypothetical protein